MSKLVTLAKSLMWIMRNRTGRIMSLPAYPKYISAAVTWNCNSRCATCGIWRAPLSKENDVEPDVYLHNVLQDPLVKQLKTFEMTGGEPMMYEGIYELTDMAFEYLPKGTEIRIGSNGIDSQRLQHYISEFSKKPLYISLSMDGIGDKHDEIRGVKGNFERLEETIGYIRHLQEKGSRVQFGASVCVSSMNLDHIPDFTIWLNQNKIPFQLTPVIFPDYAQNEYARRDKADLDFISNGDRTKVIDLFSQYDKETYQIFCDYWAGKKYPVAPCYALREYIHLRPNGDAETCMWLHRKMGNIQDNTLTEIWKGLNADALRQELFGCIACNRAHPNLCDSLNNYNFHGTLLLMRYKRKIREKLRL